MQMAAQSKIEFCFVLSTSVMNLEERKGNERSSVGWKRRDMLSGLRPFFELSLSPFLIAFVEKLLGEQGWYEYERSKASNILA